MYELISWLERIERLAAEFYRQAANTFDDEIELSAFLRQLAAEEEWHASLLASLTRLEGVHGGVLPVVIDLETRNRIELTFTAGLERLGRNEMTVEAVVAMIALLEFSEWNEFFLYGIGMLRGSGEEFRLASAEIESHRQGIITFLSGLPAGRPYVEAMTKLPAAAGRTILVVEQHPAVAQLLRRMLLPLGEVDVAESGAAGLAHVERRRYDAILADLDMGEMNGIDFYQQLAGRDPALALRCIFFVGGEDAFRGAREEGLALPRPTLVSHLFAAVAGAVRGGQAQ